MTFDRETGLEELLRKRERGFDPLPDPQQRVLGSSSIPFDVGAQVGPGGSAIPTITLAPVDCPNPEPADIILTGVNDHTVIIDALTTLNAESHSRWLHVLGGTVNMGAVVDLDTIGIGRVRISGAGMGETIFQADHSSWMFRHGNILTMEDLTLDGNSTGANAWQTGSADQDRVYFHHVEIKGFTGSGMLFQRSAGGRSEFNDCYIHNNGSRGVELGREDSAAFYGCRISSNTGTGIRAGGTGGEGTLVIGCSITDNGSHGIQSSGAVQDANRAIIIGNHINSNGGTGISLDGSDHIIIGNNIRDNGTDTITASGMVVHNRVGNGQSMGDHSGISAPGIDSTAIHDNVANEITAIAAKTDPVPADEIVAEDSEAGFVKKAIALGDLPYHSVTRFSNDGAAQYDGSAEYRAYFPFASTIIAVEASLGTQPTGSQYEVDIHLDGTTIFPTQSNRPIIAVSTNRGVATLETTAIAAGSYLTMDIDNVGSTITGQFLTVTVITEAA